MHLAIQLASIAIGASCVAVLAYALYVITRKLDDLTAAIRALNASPPTAHPALSSTLAAAEPAAPVSVPAPIASPAPNPFTPIREALQADNIPAAQARLDELDEEGGTVDPVMYAMLASEIAARRESIVTRLRATIEAARSVSDPDAVLEYHTQLAPLVSQVERETLEREQVRWFVGLLMRRMRTGTVRTDVADLARKVADAFPTHPEGASLRASLPTLRRSAGLCASCAQPYRGIDDVCPECMTRRNDSTPPPADSPWSASEPDNNDDNVSAAMGS